MLPGFRFLFAAILLSTSVLVFGLGAAALLRATHQEYVNNPSWRNGPQEQVFAQAPEPAQPVLAALRVDQPIDEPAPTLRDQVPSIGLPAVETGPEQMAAVALDANSEAKSEAQSQAKPEIQVAAVAPTADAVPPASEPSAREPATPEALAPAATPNPDDTTAAITVRTPTPTMSAIDVPRTATPALASRVNDLAAARMAALNDLDQAKPKALAPPPKSKPRVQKKKRHRIVRRPPPQPVTQALDPFGQPTLAATAATGAR